MSGAVVPLKKQIRRGVNTMKVVVGTTKKGKLKYKSPTAIKAAARASIGSSVKKDKKTNSYMAKAGFGVGKPSKAKKVKAAARHSLYKSGDARGVGLSAANIHWATLGTKPRHTKSNHFTGQMPAFLAGIVPTAALSAKSAMLAMAAHRAKIALAKEAAKRR